MLPGDSDWNSIIKYIRRYESGPKLDFKTNEWTEGMEESKKEKCCIRRQRCRQHTEIRFTLSYRLVRSARTVCQWERGSDRLAGFCTNVQTNYNTIRICITKPHKWNGKLIVFVLQLQTKTKINGLTSYSKWFLLLSNVVCLGSPPPPPPPQM